MKITLVYLVFFLKGGVIELITECIFTAKTQNISKTSGDFIQFYLYQFIYKQFRIKLFKY